MIKYPSNTKFVKVAYQYNVIREFNIPEDCLENEKSVFFAAKQNPEQFLFCGQNQTGKQKVSMSMIVFDEVENKWKGVKNEPPKPGPEIQDSQPEAQNDQGGKS